MIEREYGKIPFNNVPRSGMVVATRTPSCLPPARKR